MPRVKKELRIKNKELRIKPTRPAGSSLRATAKQSTPSASRNDKLSVPVYSLTGLKSGTMQLPKELFGVKVNKPLLAQAVRVYQNNLKAHFGNTKTRGEVAGSTRKIRAQKHTGGARHGGIRAPIFVGGGIALGPKYRKVILDLPKKMKKAALKSALSSKAVEEEILGVRGLEKVSSKTKQMQTFLAKLGKKSVLLVIDDKNEKLMRASRNLKGMEVLLSDQLNVFEATLYKTLIFTKEAVKKLELRIENKK